MRVLLLLSFVVGCGGVPSYPGDGGQSGTCAPSGALVAATSSTGDFKVYLCSSVAPARGLNTFTYLVTDSSGAPKTGMSLAVQPWMPYMNHGSPTTPTVSELDGGLYELSNVVLTMPGVWDLRTTPAGGGSDTAIPEFTID